ncbi:hypothetical protein TGAM01_v200560 [Trichoderma gamsii]|uniref:Uncharacterized protein n=1 Tax=Trichoderma gamsii TaxID=398673 RepID=A0A2P5A0Q2_9HYPO|nr:hypothetical protein TGAM01_v200560 [Trichoderma gamsii]PON30120.1 hypothetical protein TGAM01_v200560 [Trichoderma gamsii]
MPGCMAAQRSHCSTLGGSLAYVANGNKPTRACRYVRPLAETWR